MMKSVVCSTMIFSLLFASLAFSTIYGCEQQGPAERAGEKIDEAVEESTDKLEEAGDALEETAEKVEDKTD